MHKKGNIAKDAEKQKNTKDYYAQVYANLNPNEVDTFLENQK